MVARSLRAGSLVVACRLMALVGAVALVGAGEAAAGAGDGPIARLGGWGGLGGGGPISLEAPAHDCVPPWERARIEREVGAYLAANPGHHPVAGSAAGALDGPTLYPFFPHAGTLWRDLFLNNFVDLNPAVGPIQDWDCTQFTYDGHRGHDSILRSFAEQDVGVPIVAALDGTVVSRDDGHPDRNVTQVPGAPANYVVLDHGGGRLTYYFHMRRNSVAVSVGQVVRAGEHLGMTASSGFSNWPHLHFETRVNGASVEPFTGPCNAGPSGWENQIPIKRDTFPLDFGFSRTTLAGQSVPEPLSRHSNLGFGDQPHYFWFFMANVPASSTWRVRYYRPSGALEFESNVGGFGGNPAYRWAWWWFNWTIPAMNSIAGDWRMELEINGVVEVDATVTVNPTYNPAFNRPPYGVSVSLDPAAPEADDVIFCRVDTDLVNDDPDFDVVRYRYLWTVNGQVVRDVTHAGQADALPRDTAAPGQTVACEVTPGDGLLNGPAATVSAVLPGTLCRADLTTGAIPGQPGYGVPNGLLNNDDFFYYLAQFAAGNVGACDMTTGAIPGQAGYGVPNGLLNNDDFFFYLSLFAAGC